MTKVLLLTDRETAYLVDTFRSLLNRVQDPYPVEFDIFEKLIDLDDRPKSAEETAS